MANRRPTLETSHSQQPFHHTIRPHHVALVFLLAMICRPYATRMTNQRFQLHMYRILISEIAEVTEPKSLDELVEEIRKGHHFDEGRCSYLTHELYQLRVLPASSLYEIFLNLPPLWNNEDDETREPLERRSLFALFARRIFFTFRKMSFAGVAKLEVDVHAWASGDRQNGYEKVVRDAIRDDVLLVRPQFDREAFAEPEAFGEFEKCRATGDLHSAAENLRRFFEQRFNDGSDSELRQHAMLNLVRMHISSKQYAAARKYLFEAITVARTSGDNVVLQQCMALLRRIEGHSDHKREPLNELQADIPALEVLNDVSKLLHESQPLSDSFEKITQSLFVYDMSKNFRGGPPRLQEQWSFHAVQSIVWRLAGCDRLANIEENIVLAFSESGSPDDSRFKILLNHASDLARQGKEEEALKLLLDPETWRGLDYSLDQVASWSGEIWTTMLMYASRRGQRRQINGFLMPRRLVDASVWKDFIFSQPDKAAVPPAIEAQLYRALQMRRVNQAPTAIDQILKALWKTEYEGRFGLYRLAIALLADAGLEFGMKPWSKRLIDEILPQVINGDDLELRAFTCFVQARCIIACCGKNRDGLRDALFYLDKAEEDYRTIQIHHAVQDVLYVRAAVYNTLDMIRDRDNAAERHIASAQRQRELESVEVNEHWESLWNVVIGISTALASRN